MTRLLVFLIALASSVGCREYDACDDPDVSCPESPADFTCADACDKLFLVCGFEGFGNEIGVCRETCQAESVARRNLACYRDATCVAISQGECVVGSDGPYQAYAAADGPFCGEDSQDDDVFCMEGDNCVDENDNTCDRPGNGRYQAYDSAGGPYCGDDNRGEDVFCMPGDNCLGESSSECE